MLSEPREAQPRTSTFKLIAGEKPGIDLITVYQGDPTPSLPVLAASTAGLMGAPFGQGIFFLVIPEPINGRFATPLYTKASYILAPTPLHTKAIYLLAGDTLTYCVAAPGQPRPTAFATSPGDGRTHVVLQRRGAVPVSE
jgi:hypothetical protein